MGLPLESVVLVRGNVKGRKQKAKEGDHRPGSSVDEVEVEVKEVVLLNPSDEVLPFYPNRPELVSLLFPQVSATLNSRGTGE